MIAKTLAASEPWTTLEFSASSLTSYLTRADAALYRYGVFAGDGLAGVICVRFPWLRGPYIELLGLFPDGRGMGIGKELLAWAETEARRASANLWVVASSFNRQALDFYQGLGFQAIGTIPGLVRPEYGEILLRKRLD